MNGCGREGGAQMSEYENLAQEKLRKEIKAHTTFLLKLDNVLTKSANPEQPLQSLTPTEFQMVGKRTKALVGAIEALLGKGEQVTFGRPMNFRSVEIQMQIGCALEKSANPILRRLAKHGLQELEHGLRILVKKMAGQLKKKTQMRRGRRL